MKKLLLYTVFFFCTVVGYAQNLVPNFSFEQYSSCPNSGDQIQYATGWSKVSEINTTPDYYNACSTPSTTGVPKSSLLYQPDIRNCGAYIGLGIWSYTGNNDREQVGIQLNQPLVIGQKYFLSFITVMGGTSDGFNYFESPSNNIGMRLSTVAYNPSNPAPIDNFAHLRSVSIINDTANWVRITGTIIADSAYSYLMLGNFFDDTNTDTTTLNCTNCVNSYSYYLIDNICVSTDSLLCNNGVDLLPCTVSLPELSMSNSFTLSPNPTSNYFAIKSSFLVPFNVNIYSSLGQLVYSKNNITSNNLELDVSNFINGLHYITITTRNNQYNYKLLKQ